MQHLQHRPKLTHQEPHFNVTQWSIECPGLRSTGLAMVTFGKCGELNNMPPRCFTHSISKPVIMLPYKADVIKLRTLPWGDYPGLSACAQCHPKSEKKRSEKEQ